MSSSSTEARPRAPLNVLQIATSFPNWGGTELHLLNLSRQLKMRGHNVVIACQEGRWVEGRAREWGLETVPFTLRKQHDWAMLAPLRRYIRERKFDVLHAHWNSDILIPGTAALLERVPARILSRHVPHPFRSRVGGWLFGNILYSRVVTVSESVRRVMIASGVPPSRVMTIYHGTNIAEFERVARSAEEIRAELGIAPAEIAVNLAGRMTPEKGHRDVIAAATLLDASLPLRYVFTGDGPLEDELKQEVESRNLCGKFVFTGYRSDVPDVLNAMDIVTVPSTWQEPCSAVVQQGMVMRKPVVGTNVGGTPEMIVAGETGLVIPPNDPGALAGAFKTLAEQPELRALMGKAGRKRVEQEFSLQGMIDRIEALYYAEIRRANR